MGKNLTDNEIKKALEDLVKCNNNEIDCGSCALSKFYPRCPEEIGELALDLINRLQAENERLTHITRNLIAEIKAEAMTEFAENSKEEIYEWVCGDGSITYSRVKRVIDKLLKEMVGEDNESKT